MDKEERKATMLRSFYVRVMPSQVLCDKYLGGFFWFVFIAKTNLL